MLPAAVNVMPSSAQPQQNQALCRRCATYRRQWPGAL